MGSGTRLRTCVFPGGSLSLSQLGPPVVPFSHFWGEGSPTKIDYRKKLVPLIILFSLTKRWPFYGRGRSGWPPLIHVFVLESWKLQGMGVQRGGAIQRLLSGPEPLRKLQLGDWAGAPEKRQMGPLSVAWDTFFRWV